MSDDESLFNDEMKAVQDEFNRIKETLANEGGTVGVGLGRARTYLEAMYDYRDKLILVLDKFGTSIDALIQREIDAPRISVSYMLSRKEANKMLVSNLLLALQQNIEFDDPFFTEGLLMACNDERTIVISAYSRADIWVDINLDETAGSITDYAMGIKKVRAYIKSKNTKAGRPQSSGELASHFWKEKLYAPAREGTTVVRRRWNPETREYEERDVTDEQIEKYWDTMSRRIRLSGKLAPYWQLIDQGQLTLSGDGEAYPVNEPTNFVNTTKEAIITLLRERIDNQIKKIEKQREKLEAERKQIQWELDEVTYRIEILEEEITRESAPILKGPEKIFYDKVLAHSRQSGIPFSESKLREVMDALRSGDISNLSITVENRIELTEPGYPRFRVSISSTMSGFEL